MIDLNYDFGNADVYCDNCNYEEMFEGFDGRVWIGVIIEGMKERGWLIKKIGNDWQHFCPRCKGKFRNQGDTNENQNKKY